MKPMKPSTFDGDFERLRYPLLASPKLDGFRARTYAPEGGDTVVMTSNWKLFPNRFVQEALSDLPPYLDGELIVGSPRGEGVLQRTSSGVMSVEGKPDFKFYVFDHFFNPEEPFEERLRMAKVVSEILEHKRLRMVKHSMISGPAPLEEYLSSKLLAGFEGVMLRCPHGPYKFGRATPKEGHLWRIKPFVDSEMRVEDWYEQQRNDNELKRDALGRAQRSSAKAGKHGKGVLGGFTGVDVHSGEIVRVGTGFSDAQRREFWAVGLPAFKGLLLKYKRQKIGTVEKPRHPVFIDWRDEKDM